MFELETGSFGLAQLDDRELADINGGGPGTFTTVMLLALTAIIGLYTGCQDEKRQDTQKSD